MELKTQILEMIRLSSTNLSADVEKAIIDAAAKEDEGSPAKNAFNTIIENISLHQYVRILVH